LQVTISGLLCATGFVPDHWGRLLHPQNLGVIGEKPDLVLTVGVQSNTEAFGVDVKLYKGVDKLCK